MTRATVVSSGVILSFASLLGCERSPHMDAADNADVGHRLERLSGAAGAPTIPPVYKAVSISLDEGSTFDAAYDQYTKVGFRSVLHDDFGNWNSRTNELVAPQSDTYHVCVSLASFTQDFELYLFVRGNPKVGLAKSNYGAAQGCQTVDLNRGDTLDLRVFQKTAPSSIHFVPNLYWSWMTVDLVHPAWSLANWGTGYTSPSGQFTTVQFDAGTAWNSSMDQFDFSTGRFTTTSGGDFRFCASASSAKQGFELDLFVMGDRERAFAVDEFGTAGGCRTVTLSPNEYVEVKVYSASGDAAFMGNPVWNWMTIDRPQKVFASLGNTAQFVVPSTVREFTSVPFTTPLKAGNYYDPTTQRYTADARGDYQFCASLYSGGPEFEIDLFINGYRENAIAVSHYGAATGCRPIRMNPNDYVEVKVRQQTGAPVTFSSNRFWNWLTVLTTASSTLGG